MDQRMKALRKANDIRSQRAQLKRDLKAGKKKIETLLLDPPEYVLSAKTFDMLLAVPKLGRVKANRILGQCRISPSKTIGGLSERQRGELVAICADSGTGQAAFRRVRREESAPVSKVFVITGPSGVGKGTLISRLRERVPELELSVSATTRQPRAGEEDGRDYHFLDPDEFARLADDGAFLEHATFSGNRYGTLRSEIEKRLGADHPVVLEIEVQGARQVRAAMEGDSEDDAVLIFIAPPDPAVLRERLATRGTDSAEAIERRLETAKQELEAQVEFPHVVCNEDLDDAVDELEGIVRRPAGGRPDPGGRSDPPPAAL